MTRKPTPEEWTQIREQFDTLIDLPDKLRVTRLLQARGGPFVVDELRAMLAAERGAGPLDQTVPLAGAGETIDYSSLAPGTVVGAFRIERLIGRGGMGEVYLAKREAAGFTQRVALKMLRPEAVARASLFDRERKLLASLEHPGVARLIDGGMSPDGRPYMALEYVKGESITSWSAAQRVDLAGRLRLFTELCEAVDYAHARLVLHLDIKPSNVLVDREGRVRLLDFGVARIVEAAAIDRTMTQALLTPDYAAPEQFGGGMPTVATDVYALGTLLFELLAGRGPWRFDDAPLPTVLRRLLHDDPPYPSRAVTNAGLPSNKLTGDLDAIVMKAMRRDPADRYTNVAAFVADVQRHLNLQPVKARAGSNGYRFGRFVRRNRWTAAASAIAGMLLVAGVAGVALQSVETTRERDAARAEAARVEAVNEAIMLMFRDAGEARRAGSVTARELVDNTARKMVATLDPNAPKSAAVVMALSDLYVIVMDIPGSQALLEAAIAKRIGANDQIASAELQQKLAINLGAATHFDEARRLLAITEKVWSTDPARYRRQRVEAVGSRAYMLRQEGKRDEGINLLLANMADAERAYAGSAGDLATRYANLALHLVEANRLTEGKALIERARATNARTGQSESQAGLSLMLASAGIAVREGDLAKAEKVMRRTVAIRRQRMGRSFGLAIDLLTHARVVTQLNRPGEALAMLDEAKPMALEFFGPDTPPTWMIGQGRADALAMLGRLNEADRALAAVTAGLYKGGTDGLMAGIASRSRAIIALKRGRLDTADEALTIADSVFRKIGPAAVPYARSVAPLRAEITAARAKRT